MKLRWFGQKPKPDSGDQVGNLWRMLQQWQPKRERTTAGDGVGDGEGPSVRPDAEVAVLNRVRQEQLYQEQQAHKTLSRRVEALNRAFHTNAGAWQHLAGLVDERRGQIPPAVSTSDTKTTGPDPQAQTDSDHDGTGATAGPAHYDAWRPVVSERLLTALEIVFVIVEFFFWNSLLSQSTPYGEAWYSMDHLYAYLLATLIPLVGVAVARTVGYCCHRLVMNYPGISRRRHLGAPIAVIALVAVIVAVAWLVCFRFSAAGQMVGVSSPPAIPMAVIFCLALVVDAFIRTFLAAEVHTQQRELAVEYRKRVDAALTANGNHRAAWDSLALAVQHQTAVMARLNTVGTGLLTETSAWFGDAAATSPEPPASQSVKKIGVADATDSHGDPMSLIVPASALTGDKESEGPWSGNPVLLFAASRTTVSPPKSDLWVVTELERVWSDLHGGRKTGRPTVKGEPADNGHGGHAPAGLTDKFVAPLTPESLGGN